MLTKFSDFPRYTAGREQITNRNVAGAIASILLPSLGATLAIEGSVAFGVMLIVAGLIVVAMGARSIVIKSNKAHTVNGDYARKLSTLGETELRFALEHKAEISSHEEVVLIRILNKKYPGWSYDAKA